MDFLKLETTIASMVRRQLGRTATVTNGPLGNPSFARTKVVAHVHVKEFQDFGGITADGAHIGRRLLSKTPNLKGYGEERNGRIIGELIIASTNHSTPPRLCGVLATEVLSTLDGVKSILLGRSMDKKSSLVFSDFTAYLNSSKTDLIFSTQTYHVGIVEFCLDGFLHVKVLRSR